MQSDGLLSQAFPLKTHFGREISELTSVARVKEPMLHHACCEPASVVADIYSMGHQLHGIVS